MGYFILIPVSIFYLEGLGLTGFGVGLGTFFWDLGFGAGFVAGFDEGPGFFGAGFIAGAGFVNGAGVGVILGACAGVGFGFGTDTGAGAVFFCSGVGFGAGAGVAVGFGTECSGAVCFVTGEVGAGVRAGFVTAAEATCANTRLLDASIGSKVVAINFFIVFIDIYYLASYSRIYHTLR